MQKYALLYKLDTICRLSHCYKLVLGLVLITHLPRLHRFTYQLSHCTQLCLSAKHWPIQEVGSRNANVVKDEPCIVNSIERHLDAHVCHSDSRQWTHISVTDWNENGVYSVSHTVNHQLCKDQCVSSVYCSIGNPVPANNIIDMAYLHRCKQDAKNKRVTSSPMAGHLSGASFCIVFHIN